MTRSILGIICFYIANWIGKSIFYSFVDDSTTIQFIANGEWYLAGGIGFMICFIFAILDDLFQENNDDDHTVICVALLICSTIGASYMPFSWGLAVIYNIIMIGCIGRMGYKN